MERTNPSLLLYYQDHRSFGASSLQIDASAASQSQDVFARTPKSDLYRCYPTSRCISGCSIRSVLEVYQWSKINV